MGNANAFYFGAKAFQTAQDQAYERERQAKLDEIAAERLARERKDWEYQDKQNAVIDAEREAAIAAVSQPLTNANSPQGVKAELGLDVPQSAAAMRRGDERFKYGSVDAFTPEAPGAQPQFAIGQQNNTLAKLKMAGRDPRLIAAARADDTKTRLSADAARISSYAQSANETELKDLMGKVTLDKRNKYETEFNEKTGVTRIKHGETSVELSRADLGKFLAAQYRLKNGDESASADIEAIDEKLAKVVSESLKTSSTLAKSGNDAIETESKIRNDNLRTASAIAKAGAGAAKPAAYWSKDADEHIVKLNSFTNPETGRSEIDGNGAQFMQRVALDAAAKNGGNTMAAISRAAEVDQSLKVMAKGDPAVLAQLRAKALADASAPKAPVAPVVAPTPAAIAQQAGIKPPTQVQASPQAFNAAGYSDVQSTIDGARRGDQKALALLRVLIDRGETTPAQRQQIANLTK